MATKAERSVSLTRMRYSNSKDARVRGLSAPWHRRAPQHTALAGLFHCKQFPPGICKRQGFALYMVQFACADAMQMAENFIRRNAPGDKEKAFQVLISQFGEDGVFEIPA